MPVPATPCRRSARRPAGRGVDAALELIGSARVMEQAVQSLAPQGRAALAGLTQERLSVAPYRDILGREAEIIGVSDHLASGDRRADAFHRARRAGPSSQAITRVVPLEAAAINGVLDGLEAFRRRRALRHPSLKRRSMRAMTQDVPRSEEVVSAEVVQAALDRMARDITARLADRNPLVITVLNGGLVFAGQLLPRLPFALDISYVHVRRYGRETKGGELVWIAGPQESVTGRTVLLLDDILDEGQTLLAIRSRLYELGASEVLLAAFAVKIRTGAAQGHGGFHRPAGAGPVRVRVRDGRRRPLAQPAVDPRARGNGGLSAAVSRRRRAARSSPSSRSTTGR